MKKYIKESHIYLPVFLFIIVVAVAFVMKHFFFNYSGNAQLNYTANEQQALDLLALVVIFRLYYKVIKKSLIFSIKETKGFIIRYRDYKKSM